MQHPDFLIRRIEELEPKETIKEKPKTTIDGFKVPPNPKKVRHKKTLDDPTGSVIEIKPHPGNKSEGVTVKFTPKYRSKAIVPKISQKTETEEEVVGSFNLVGY